MRCFFRVEYNGANYAGWQSQVDAVSVQSTLDKAFSTAVRQSCRVVGAGRTDAGVHARGQGAHIDLPENVDLTKCIRSVNALLPHDIAIYDLAKVCDDFHARYSAVRRLYKYRITTRKSPLVNHQCWHLPFRVDWQKIRKEASLLIGEYDFTAFCASGHTHNTMNCKVHQARFDMEEKYVVFTIEANRFLYKMVRSITGTLVDIGRGRIQESLSTIIGSRDRSRVGDTAPACGLVLENVFYPKGHI